jgi:hypothetical protein
MASTLTDEEEGKTVVDASGEPLGLVTAVEEDTAYVEPNPDLAESIAARLGWGDAEEDDYTAHADAVGETTDEEVRLREEL